MSSYSVGRRFYFLVIFLLWSPVGILHRSRVVGNTNEQNTHSRNFFVLVLLIYDSSRNLASDQKLKKTRCEYKRTRKHRVPLCFFQCILLHNFILLEFHIGHSDRLAQFLKDFLANRNESKILVYLIASNL